MCGIVAYTGNRSAVALLVSGLKRLEYRGYDSAGIAVQQDGCLVLEKQSGTVSRLEEALAKQADLSRATCGIAHTRWATHGPPTSENAHPHAAGNIAVVHNGIIENHAALRADLEAGGAVFLSETDTEVLAHLIHRHYAGDLRDAVTEALQSVQGTYGIAVVAADAPNELVVARRGSPIVIGLGQEETLIASDPTAILTHTRQVVYLDDNDVALVNAAGVDIRTLDARPVRRETSEINWSPEAADKGGFPHYMLKEIHDQPEALANAMRGRLDADRGTALLSGLNFTPRTLSEIDRLMVVGCGTSLLAGMVGEYAMEDFAGIHAEVEQAAEFRYRNPIVGSHDLVLAVSQSGETADTLAAVREAMEKGATVAGLVNVVGSTIARETGRGVYLHAGPEISVASTKAFSTQVAVLLMIALKFARSRRMSRERGIAFVRELEALPSLVEQVIATSDRIAEVAERFEGVQNAFFLGRGYLYPAALEGALKMKEISYIHAEGYHAAELKHGPLALLDESVPVVALLTQGPGREKTLSNVAECRARSAPVIGVITQGDREAAAAVDAFIEVPAAPAHTGTIPTTVALQLLAYHVARLRGCSIDQPRNLAKSVTVE